MANSMVKGKLQLILDGKKLLPNGFVTSIGKNLPQHLS